MNRSFRQVSVRVRDANARGGALAQLDGLLSSLR